MFIAMNCFKVMKGAESAFEHRLAFRATAHLDRVPGFVEFHLLRGPEREDHVLYASHTVWASKEAFTAWTQSEHFRAAHRGRRRKQAAGSRPPGVPGLRGPPDDQESERGASSRLSGDRGAPGPAVPSGGSRRPLLWAQSEMAVEEPDENFRSGGDRDGRRLGARPGDGRGARRQGREGRDRRSQPGGGRGGREGGRRRRASSATSATGRPRARRSPRRKPRTGPRAS